MADPARPALARTLAVLTGTSVDLWEHCRRVAPDGPVIGMLGNTNVPAIVRWLHSTPAEAQEALSADGVLPQGWCGDPRRGWHDRTAADDGWGDWRDVVLPAPRTIPDLAAVASLGWPAIQAAEELAREACHALASYGVPTPDRVVWRVGRRGEPSRLVDLGCKVSLYADGTCWAPSGDPNRHEVDVPTARALWTSGLAIDRITPEAVVVVVPPVGGAGS